MTCVSNTCGQVVVLVGTRGTWVGSGSLGTAAVMLCIIQSVCFSQGEVSPIPKSLSPCLTALYLEPLPTNSFRRMALERDTEMTLSHERHINAAIQVHDLRCAR